MSRPKSITIVAGLATPNERVRLRKLNAILQDMDLDVRFWGWRRKGREATPAGKTKIRILMRGGEFSSKRLLLWYPIWMKVVFWNALLFGRGTKFYAVSFDSAYPLACLSRIRKVDYLFDDPDNITKSYSWPGKVRKFLEGLERFTVARAAIHLVPGEDRWPSPDANRVVIKNFPARDDLEEAKRIAETLPPKDPAKLTLYVNGRLVAQRGIDVLIDALKLAKDPRIEVILAGNLITPEAEALAALPQVRYLGTLDQPNAMAWYTRSDLTLTFYDPAIEINRLAEPNKWGDCVAIGTPFLVNSEVETARPFLEADACLHVPYRDTQALADLLDRLCEDRSRIETVRANLAKQPFTPWDELVRQMLERWLAA